MSGQDGRVAAIGEEYRIAGYALAGVQLHPAPDATAARQAWAGLEADVVLVLLTRSAAAALAPAAAGAAVSGPSGPLTAVLP
ncbi:hypothetical protein BN1051_01256 [Arthrobacter saudimassiliensis]|uniref:V-type ATP synthase subunit F n=1 Tax=Arthrobacter saudimassiliensis TaxID=1461584 RepID=A0A078MNT3_9MICC|nr:hypothetical protein BN1051_01256 [Arthrobacter saudimassiliensis]